ncbi:hypothetical protein ZYGR_0I00770 [Zygosaccharomyces rouxii]|uniref:ZYRO0C01914p n=2 Tax=Zygosaccharomyces rouxii TaxID=4956 RepID=C5DSP4_ZYGRC|nr:uncharacterized protein ZYRO0C01914g [Zygosaccharomyces rouxii]KAH9202005.1 hypothetical protein LQ764DRAFT_91975 [Zygosaccharomyces rouxii]GAV47781.1 hypothetical protein ZYGR_0I00770 [Zygosaccharomyces rouxii]CAR26805.1 ZYRO0C01914p [Zygosaccharomyces rouxii]
MGEFIPIRLVGSDENSTQFNYLQGKNEKVLQQQQQQQYGGGGGAIKLRDLNTEVQRPISQRTLELVEYLRKPEPALGSSVKLRPDSAEMVLGTLGEVKSMYIPESPSLLRTLTYNTNSSTVRLIKMDDGSTLDLSPVSKIYDGDFDCQPFYHTYDYENRLEVDDYDSILNQMVEDDLNNSKPTFYRELEYQEMKKIVGITDYILYYVFGIDKLQFFQLKGERDKFREFNYESYTCPLKYRDPEFNDLKDDEQAVSSDEDYETDQALCDTSSVMSLDMYV